LDALQKLLPTAGGISLTNRMKPGKPAGQLICDKFEATKRIGFLDYIQGGSEVIGELLRE
jgi:hypothetical protein